MDPNRWANKCRMFDASVYHAEPTVASGDDLHLITVNDPKIRCSYRSVRRLPSKPYCACPWRTVRPPWGRRCGGCLSNRPPARLHTVQRHRPATTPQRPCGNGWGNDAMSVCSPSPRPSSDGQPARLLRIRFAEHPRRDFGRFRELGPRRSRSPRNYCSRADGGQSEAAACA